MSQVYVPLFSALAGALIGSASSLLTIWLQNRSQERRERIRVATQIAIEEWKTLLDHYKEKGSMAYLHPLPTFIDGNLRIMSAIGNDGLDLIKARKAAEQNRMIRETFKSFAETEKLK